MQVISGSMTQLVVSRTPVEDEALRALGFAEAMKKSGIFGWVESVSGNGSHGVETAHALGSMFPIGAARTVFEGSLTIERWVVPGDKLTDCFGIPPAPNESLEDFGLRLLAEGPVSLQLINRLTKKAERSTTGLINADGFRVSTRGLMTGSATMTLLSPF